MNDRNIERLESAQPQRFAEDADSIRKQSPGDQMSAGKGGNNNKNTVSMGGFWVALFAILIAAVAFSSSYNARVDFASLEARMEEHIDSLDNGMRSVVMEKRLLQEDMMMLRAALRAHGVEVETSGDHE